MKGSLSLPIIGFCLLSACGSPGLKPSGPPPSGDAKPKDPPPKKEEDPYGLRLSITTKGLGSFEMELPFCNSEEYQGLAKVDLILDGSLEEWNAVSPAMSDAAGDSAPAFDIQSVAIATTSGDLALAMQFAKTGNSATSLQRQVYVELGGMLANDQNIRQENLRLFRIDENNLYDFENGAWQLIESSRGGAVSLENTVEVRLGRRLVSEALNWQAWWVRVYTGNGTDTAVDTTAAYYYQTQLDDGLRQFSIHKCKRKISATRAIAFQELRDLSTNKAHAAQDFAISRFALQSIGHLFEEGGYPVDTLALIASDRNDMTNPGFSSAARPNDSLYRGIRLDARVFSADAQNAEGQEGVLVEAFRHLVGVYIDSTFMEAPNFLKLIFTTAVVDQSIRKNIGLYYWLKVFREQVRSPDAKDLMFAHLLGDFFKSGDLIKAWGKSAAVFRQAPDRNIAEILKEQLQGVTTNPNTVEKLWRGWLLAGSHHPDFAPQSLDDDDSDGIPNYREKIMATNPQTFDSDGDGWSDLAEISVETLPNNPNSQPRAIIDDQSFDDWLEVLPNYLTTDSDEAVNDCPQAGNMTHYAALLSHSHLMVGASTARVKAGETPISWEIFIELLKIDTRYLVIAKAGSPYFTIRDADNPETILKQVSMAAPLKMDNLEVLISKDLLNLDKDFAAPNTVNVRLRTTAGEHGTLCDDTPWFSPMGTD